MDHRPSIRHCIHLSLLTVLLLASTSCDPSVDVFNPSDQNRFSLFGTLEVGADTQVVRVESLQDSVQAGAPPTLDVQVTLENLDTGQQVSLRDSFATAGVSKVHNFWTTHPIRAATPYRISVRRSGKPIATATTRTPAHPPKLTSEGAIKLPCLEDSLYNTFYVRAREVKHIAAAKTILFPRSTSGPPPARTFNHSRGIEEKGEEFLIPIFYKPDLEALNIRQPKRESATACADLNELGYQFAYVVVSAGGPDWPEWLNVPLNEVARPNTFSNVKGGHGYVGGIYSDTIRVPIYQPTGR